MSSRKGVPAMDLVPEYFPYHDDGCEVSSSCLQCPLPQCKYDDPGWLQRRRRQERDGMVLQVRRMEGATIVELARRFEISQRTVHRILAQANRGLRDYTQNGHSPPADPQWPPVSQQLAR